MPWTLTNDAGFLVQEGTGDFVGNPDAGLTLHEQFFPRAPGVGPSDTLKLENGILRAATPEEVAAENAEERRREKGRLRQRLREDKVVTNAILETVRLAVNKNLPAGSRITKNEIKTSWQAVVDALTDNEV